MGNSAWPSLHSPNPSGWVPLYLLPSQSGSLVSDPPHGLGSPRIHSHPRLGPLVSIPPRLGPLISASPQARSSRICSPISRLGSLVSPTPPLGPLIGTLLCNPHHTGISHSFLRDFRFSAGRSYLSASLLHGGLVRVAAKHPKTVSSWRRREIWSRRDEGRPLQMERRAWGEEKPRQHTHPVLRAHPVRWCAHLVCTLSVLEAQGPRQGRCHVRIDGLIVGGRERGRRASSKPAQGSPFPLVFLHGWSGCYWLKHRWCGGKKAETSWRP